ncbi:MAG: response regulator [Bacteroidales bacterium]|nr:response regulator [Bacteroidales bacterium]
MKKANKRHKAGKLHDNIPRSNIRSIEISLLSATALLILSAALMLLGHAIAAVALIALVIAAGTVIWKKNMEVNKKYVSLIASMLKNDEKKNRLIAGFSHRIREPLNNLIITESIISEAGFTPKQKELFDTINASTKSMIEAVNDLTMDVAESISFESRKQIQFNVGSTIEHVIELYSTGNSRNIDFDFLKTGAPDVDCVGDPVAIKQIFIDIFGKIEEQQCGRKVKTRISFTVTEKSPSQNAIAITVATDVRMSFIDEHTAEAAQLTKLILSMGGEYIQSKTASASSITMSFGIKKAVHSLKEDIPSAKIEELIKKEKSRKDMKDFRVLLVEDNIINSRITQIALQPQVKSIDLAVNGKEAVEMFAANSYDIILMDIQLPVMDGLVATEKIRALESTTNRHVPIIALTANAMIGDKENCLSAGADDYISKPFNPQQLIEKIQQTI